MEIDIGFGGDFADLFHGLQHTGFVVGHHDGDEPRIRPQGPPDIIGIYSPVAIHRNVSHLTAGCLQLLARVQHCMVFDRRGNDVVARFDQTKDCQVVAFRATAGEDNL